MTDRPIRRTFLKTAAASIAILAIRPTRDGNAFFDVKSESGQTAESEIIMAAVRTWRPNPALKITGLEVGVSEHARFVQNQLVLRIRADTRLTEPLLERPGLYALMLINREMVKPAGTPEGDHLTRCIHATLNGNGAFSWVGEAQMIPESPIVACS